eukprot:TRINITY_DN9534_c0_g1_i4.p1 TRINITY_DN9534_c0_g1~~TRINITY_DN9534_c0_g1_i4.p1  ORF type:complete len:152 (+),score=27.23 TRINITY_DN9534_c0_g1_i4:37-492(+)
MTSASFIPWTLSLVVIVALLLVGFLAYLVIVELEEDHLNPIHGCQRLRPLLLTEAVLSMILFMTQFFEWDIVAIIATVVPVCYQIYAMGHDLLHADATKIFQQLKVRHDHQQGRLIYYLALLSIFLYKFLRLFAKGIFRYFARNFRLFGIF